MEFTYFKDLKKKNTNIACNYYGMLRMIICFALEAIREKVMTPCIR